MTTALRIVALAVALAAIIDPVMARQVSVPLSVEVVLPRESDPGYQEATRLRGQLLDALGEEVSIDGARPPQAAVLLGRAAVPTGSRVPMFALPASVTPSVAIEALRAPGAVPGQTVPVVAALRAVGLAGRKSTVTLALAGTVVHTEDYQWKDGDERRDITLPFVPSAAGLQRVRVAVRTDSEDGAVVADVGVAVRDRRLRVLAYEPRPSWPLAFVRRSLEADPAFDVAATTRTTGRNATSSIGAPAALSTLQPDRFDAILVGAPEALSDADIRALEGFAGRRGGSIVLLPDQRMPTALLRRFGLPALEEVVLERPLTVDGSGAALRASELLLATASRAGEALGRVRHGTQDRAAVLSSIHGEGRVILSGALDAWRYRAEANAAFDDFWRGLVADAAAASPPPLAITVAPRVARPGDPIEIAVTLRGTEFSIDRAIVDIPAVSARFTSTDGRSETVRLWPGVRPGSYVAETPAPAAGSYTLTVTAAGVTTDAPLLVADDAVEAVASHSTVAAFAAGASGGAVAADVQDLAARLRAMDAARAEQKTYPMRSPWWLLPFAGALTAEWALRRRSGRR